MFCTNCGNPISEKDKICNRCNKPIHSTPIAALTRTPRKPKPKRKIIILAPTLCVLLVTFIVLVSTHVICINHDFSSATCISAETCKYCGTTNGRANGHRWDDATCTDAKTCKKCGLTKGYALGHNWMDATCTTPKTCTTCDKTEGDTHGHISGQWVVAKEATLIQAGMKEIHCSTCDEILDSKSIEKKAPKVVGLSFNFTDEEFIDWVENISTLKFVLMNTGDQNNTYAISNTKTDETGILILNHKKYDTDGNICLIAMYMFDNNAEAMVFTTYIGELINSRFSSDDAFTKLYYDETYIKADMTTTMLELVDGMDFAVLAPTEYFEYILS